MTVHIDKKPYAYSMYQKAFVQRSTLCPYFRVQSGDKPYACSLCQEAFVQKKELGAHFREHSVKTPYVCTLCQETFANKINLDCTSTSAECIMLKFNIYLYVKKHLF